MNDRGMNNLSIIMAPPWSINQVCSTPPIVHVAIAVADSDETYGAYGAYAAAENNTFTNTNNSANNVNDATNSTNNANYNAYWLVPIPPVRFLDPSSAGSGSTSSGYSVLYWNRAFH